MTHLVGSTPASFSPLPKGSDKKQPNIAAGKDEFETHVNKAKAAHAADPVRESDNPATALDAAGPTAKAAPAIVSPTPSPIDWAAAGNAQGLVPHVARQADAQSAPPANSARAAGRGLTSQQLTLPAKTESTAIVVDAKALVGQAPLSSPTAQTSGAPGSSLVAEQPIVPTFGETAPRVVDASIQNVDSRVFFGVQKTNLSPATSERLDRLAATQSVSAPSSGASVATVESPPRNIVPKPGYTASRGQAATKGLGSANGGPSPSIEVVSHGAVDPAARDNPGDATDNSNGNAGSFERPAAIAAPQDAFAALSPLVEVGSQSLSADTSSTPSTPALASAVLPSVSSQQPARSLDLQFGAPGDVPMTLKMKLVGGSLAIVMEIADPVALTSMQGSRNDLTARFDGLGQPIDSIVIRAPAASGEGNVNNSNDETGRENAKRPGSDGQADADVGSSAAGRDRRAGDRRRSGDLVV